MNLRRCRSAPMKVLIVGPSLNPEVGGVAHYYNAVLPRLSPLEVEAHYLEIGSHHGRKRIGHVVTDQLRLASALDSFKPDIVHVNPSYDFKSFIRDGVFIAQSRLRHLPVLVFFRGWSESFDRLSERTLPWFFRHTYARADAFVVLASQFVSRLRAKGISAPIFRSHTAVPDDAVQSFSISRRIERLGTAVEHRVLFMARLERKKGAEEVIDAIAALRRRNIPVRLGIAGEGSQDRRLRRKTARLGLSDAVAFLGYVRGEDKAAVLRQHDVYCLPSDDAEGMPNSILEAMAYGMPIVTLPTAGIQDFFENGRMGVLVKARAAAEVERAILSLIQEPARLVEIARYNHAYVMRHFLASRCASALLEFYRHVLVQAEQRRRE